MVCWDFTGQGRISEKGYGRTGKSDYTHRLAYEAFFGLIPTGLQLDHLCRNRACYNPFHLEPVTPGENTRRSPLVGRSTNRPKFPNGYKKRIR